MLKTNRSLLPTREEVIEFIRSLPDDMVCIVRSIEVEPVWISIATLNQPVDITKARPFSVTFTFERDMMHSDK